MMIRFDPPLTRVEIGIVIAFGIASLIAGYAFGRWLLAP